LLPAASIGSWLIRSKQALLFHDCINSQTNVVYRLYLTVTNRNNCLGALRQLAQYLNDLNQSAKIAHLNQKLTKWYFNTPTAAHFGGRWKRMIRVAKETLVVGFGRQPLTD
jgi:hypothetical protein